MPYGFNDTNFYPKAFKSFTVTSQDVNGNPLITEFYSESAKTTLVFTWTQIWDSNNVCTSWVITVA